MGAPTPPARPTATPSAAGSAAAASPASASPAAPGTGLRLVVFGDSTFASDQLLDANLGNAALLGDTLNWLVERDTALGIPPKRPEQVRLSLSQSQYHWTLLLVLLVLPVLAIVLGVFVYVRRRR